MAAPRMRSLPRFSQTLNTRSRWWKSTERPLRLGSASLTPGRQQFVEREAGGSAAVGPARLHDGERHQDGARPRGHFVEHVARQHDDFGRHRGHVLARVEAEQAEVDLDVAVGRLQAAERQDALARAAQRLAIRIEAGEFERAIGFHGGADVGGAAGVDIEAAIGQLAIEDGAGGAVDAGRGRGGFQPSSPGWCSQSCSRM